MRTRRTVLKLLVLAGLVIGGLQPASAGVASAEINFSQGAFVTGKTSGTDVAAAFLIKTDLAFASAPVSNRVFDTGPAVDQTFVVQPGVVDGNAPELFGCIVIAKFSRNQFDAGCQIVPPATLSMQPAMTKATMILTVQSALWPSTLTAVLPLEEIDDETDGLDNDPTVAALPLTKAGPSGIPYEAQLTANGSIVRPARVIPFGTIRSHWYNIGGTVTQHTGHMVQALSRWTGQGFTFGASVIANIERPVCDPSLAAPFKLIEDTLGRDLPFDGGCLFSRP